MNSKPIFEFSLDVTEETKTAPMEYANFYDDEGNLRLPFEIDFNIPEPYTQN
ncbi:MAG: hypothetical protein ACI9BD_000116 [Candidatus Marinamargulisbacteria bacterium]|jgi:hypothetical protein